MIFCMVCMVANKNFYNFIFFVVIFFFLQIKIHVQVFNNKQYQINVLMIFLCVFFYTILFFLLSAVISLTQCFNTFRHFTQTARKFPIMVWTIFCINTPPFFFCLFKSLHFIINCKRPPPQEKHLSLQLNEFLLDFCTQQPPSVSPPFQHEQNRSKI